MLKDSVIALLQDEKAKKIAAVTESVGLEFDQLMAAVQGLPEEVADDVAALRTEIEALQKSLAEAQQKLLDLQAKEEDEVAKLAVDEAKIQKIKDELSV